MSRLRVETDLELLTCCVCGMLFAMPSQLVAERQRDHVTFFCPAGHPQIFAAESPEELLQKQLRAAQKYAAEMREWGEQEAERRRVAERAHAATKGVLTKTRNRVAAGVCPCCNRTFQNLQRHMAGQHPEYQEPA